MQPLLMQVSIQFFLRVLDLLILYIKIGLRLIKANLLMFYYCESMNYKDDVILLLIMCYIPKERV